MSEEVKNATDFLQIFRQIASQYEGLIRPKFLAVANSQDPQFDGMLGGPDQLLEAHSRIFIIDALLRSLNWIYDFVPGNSPSLMPEAPARSLTTGHRRHLDYLGFESSSNRALMIVETKRPSAQLPDVLEEGDSGIGVTRETFLAIAISKGLRGSELTHDWQQWLADLKDYFLSIGQTNTFPRRVVITNGDWLVVFVDPQNAFLGEALPENIKVFEDRKDIEKRAAQLFTVLEYHYVLRERPYLNIDEIGFSVSKHHISRVMHGLRIAYVNTPGVFGTAVPVFRLAPVLLLQSTSNAWIQVLDPPKDYELPHDYDRLHEHMDLVLGVATKLLEVLNVRLGSHFTSSPIEEHYRSGWSHNGVLELSANNLVVVTGQHTHFILKTPTVMNCPYHDWPKTNDDGKASPPPIFSRSVSPRSFFRSGEQHFCAHKTVVSIKASAIGPENRKACGARSGQDGEAFCEIYPFEQRLCCRTCIFQTVCSKSTLFILPCVSA